MRPSVLTLLRDQTGTTMVEFTIVAVAFFLLTFGLVDFGYAFFQYTSAAKAAELGARLAAVSNPVWTELTTSLTDPGTPGSAWTTNYNVTCVGTNATGSAGTCTGTVPSGVTRTYRATALQCLVFGRNTGGTCQTACGTVGNDGDPGMCDIYGRITPDKVQVTYEHSGLGFAGRPGGPVPTITVTLTGLTYEFIGLGGLLGFGDATMPDFKVTMTGEDLSAAAVP